MLLDFENMLKKYNRNRIGNLIWEQNDIKYSMEWYRLQNFRENNRDNRMVKF